MRSLPALLCVMPLFADTYPRQPGIDAQHYIFRLTLSDDSDEIAGEATIDLRFVADGVKEFSLDLSTVAEGKGMKVSSVSAKGEPLHYTHQADRLSITLPAAPKAGE